MPKTEASRHVRLTDQVEAQQLVDRVERSRRWGECGSRGELGVEGVARYRRALEHEACSIGEKRDLLREGRGDEWRHAQLDERSVLCGRSGRGRPVERPGQLFQVEGVTAAVVVQRSRNCLVHRRVEQLRRLGTGQGAEIESGQRVRSPCPLEGRRQSPRCLAGPERHRDQDGCIRRAAQERPDQLDRGGVGPMDIVEGKHQRRRRRQALEQLTGGAVAAVALVLDCALSGNRELGERGKDDGEGAAGFVTEGVEAARLEASQVVVDRIDEDPERQLALEL